MNRAGRFGRLGSDPQGATAIEFALVLPVLIMMIWAVIQGGLVFRANSGIQNALGEGARLATLYPTPTQTAISTRMQDAVFGIGPGHFTSAVTSSVADDPTTPAVDESLKREYFDLTVTYSQSTDLLIVPGPTVNMSKTKRVWVAGQD